MRQREEGGVGGGGQSGGGGGRDREMETDIDDNIVSKNGEKTVKS